MVPAPLILGQRGVRTEPEGETFKRYVALASYCGRTRKGNGNVAVTQLRTRASRLTVGSRLVERKRELVELAGSLEAAREGAGRTVLIDGPAGQGKSSLLTATGELAAECGMRVLRATASEVECDFPFGVALQLFEPAWTLAGDNERASLGAGAAKFASTLLQGQLPAAHSAAGDLGFPLIHSLFWLTRNLAMSDAGAAPLAILVDDLQWSDRLSLRFLAYLAARVATLPIALVVALSRGEGTADPSAVKTLVHSLATILVRPKPLSDAGVDAVVLSAFPAATPAFLAGCSRVTRGNPFLLAELLSQLSADLHAPDDLTATRLDELAPHVVVDSVVARLGALGSAARALACAVAVMGDGTPLKHAARLAGLELDEAAKTADALATVQLFDRTLPLSFVQPAIRTATLASISPVVLGEAHRRAGRILREGGAAAEALAGHLLEASADDDLEAVETLRLVAGEALGRGDALSAVRLLERALAERPPREVHAMVLGELAQAEAVAGIAQAAERLDAAIKVTADPHRRAELALTKGGAIAAQGNYSGAAAAFEIGLRELNGADPALAEELDAAFIAVAVLVRPTVDEALTRRMRMLERMTDHPAARQRVALARTTLQDSLRAEQRSTVRRFCDLAWGGGALLESNPHDEISLSSLTGALLFVDELEQALEISDATLPPGAARGAPPVSETASYGRVWPLYEQGQISKAAAEASVWRDPPAAAPAPVRTGSDVLACCLLYDGQLEAAERQLAIIEAEDVRGSMRQAFLLDVRAQLRLAQHRPREALLDALRAGSALESDFGVTSPGAVAWRSTAALAQLALGDRTTAAELAAEELKRARRIGVTRVVVRALRVLGLAEGGESGIALLEEALGLAVTYPMRLESIHAMIEYGAALRRAKKRAAAREPLRKALELSHRGGAAALSQRASTELAASGARPRQLLMSGVAALTPSERRVSDLAASGMTTRQIAEALYVTPKTVEFHLRQTYRKLDVGSREELADALRTESAEKEPRSEQYSAPASLRDRRERLADERRAGPTAADALPERFADVGRR